MVVKVVDNKQNILRTILKDQNGIIFTSDLNKYDIPREYISILVKNGELKRISRGIYSDINTIVDDMYVFQARFNKAIFSHETALYLLGLSDRTPLSYSVTLPSGYNAKNIKECGTKAYFVKLENYLLGLKIVKSSHENDLKTYNLERTICDVIRNRNRMDIQFVNNALKNYIKHKDRNLDQLNKFAKRFKIQKFIREYIEVLL